MLAMYMLPCIFCYAQKVETDYDTAYIESYYHRLVISASALYNKHEIALIDRNGKRLATVPTCPCGQPLTSTTNGSPSSIRPPRLGR